MKRMFLIKFGRHLFWGAMIALLFSPSFSRGEPAKPELLTINKIEVSRHGEKTRVFIEGSAPLEYTAFARVKPARVIIDIPKAVLGKLQGFLQVQDGIIKNIQNKQIEEAENPRARVEIFLEREGEYFINSEGSIIIVDFEGYKAALTPAAEKKEIIAEKRSSPQDKLITEIQISPQPNFLEVGLVGPVNFPEFRSFRLPNPPRLVLDIPEVRNGTGKKRVEVASPWLKDIRLGQNQDKLRVVFTFPEKEIPPYRLQREGREIKVTLGHKEEVKKEETKAHQTPQEEKENEPIKLAETELKKEVKRKETGRPPVDSPPPAEKSPDPGQAQEKASSPNTPPASEKAQLSPYKGAKISLDFKDADLHNIFRLLAEVSNLNIITTDDVKGKITIRMVNVPWDQALDVILTTKNLVKIEEGNVLRIATAESVRREREEKQKEEDLLIKLKESREKLETLSTETISVNYAKAAELQRLIREKEEKGKGFLSPRGSVKADERTNTLIIQDTKENIEEIKKLIKKLDSPTPQVLIEARVVQAQTTFARSLGIQWGGSYNQTGGGQWHWGLTGNNPSAAAGWGFTPSATGTSTPLIMPSNFVVNFPAATGNTQVGGLGISFGKLTGNLVNLDLRLQLGETEGQTKVIARPKLATLTNTPAHIKQGELIPYETTSQAGTQVQFIDAVLMLEVTPQVTPDGSIKMTVKVTRDSRGTFRSPSMQVPSIDKREAKTEVLVKDGETLVIGGIYESENQESETRIPWLGKIPILGWLFKNKEVYSSKKELLIFITPTLLQGLRAES